MSATPAALASKAAAGARAATAGRGAPRWRIRWIVTAAMVALTAGAVIGVGAVSQRHARRALEAEMKFQLLLQARHLAMVGSGALLSSIPEWTLLPLIKEMRGRQPYLAFVVVTDRLGVIRADSEVRRLGMPFAPPAGLLLEPEPGAAASGEALLGNPALLVASASIVHADGRVLGAAWVGLRREAVDRRLDEVRRQQLVVLCLFLAFGTTTALLLSSVLLRPIGALRAGLERIARGDLETRIELRDRTELGALAEVVNRMAGELKGAQVELLERERIAHEVQLARRIQRSLLPAGRRLAGPFEIEGRQRAAAEVGGDYFQTLDLPDGRVGLVVADVSGKGLVGSLVTAMLHALLKPMAPAHATPGGLLAGLDRQMGDLLERGSFVTMFYGILDPRGGEVAVASAGHNPALLLRRGGRREWVKVPGAPLGALRGSRARRDYPEVAVRLGPGDALVQYTDGIHEALGGDGRSFFGLERMAEAAEAAAAGGLEAVLEALSRAVDAWRQGAAQHDDETLLVVSRRADAHADGAAGQSSEAEGLARLAEARARGRRLTLPASPQALVRLEDWLRTLPELAGLDRRAAGLLRLALHEACGNVVEHACRRDAARTYDLWWLPAAGEGAALGRGEFVLRDRGVSFRYQDHEPPRWEDRAVRRRGRGFGLEIVRRVMRSVAYHPGTPEGNIAFLAFDPGRPAGAEEGHGQDG